jgi:deoxycytidylate deaminase
MCVLLLTRQFGYDTLRGDECQQAQHRDAEEQGTRMCSTIYCTHTPCVLCAKMLVNTRIKRFVSYGKYNDDTFMSLFKEARIQFEAKKRPPSTIKFLD